MKYNPMDFERTIVSVDAERAAMNIVLTERARQRRDEGFTDSGDDDYTDQELAYAAACYTIPLGPVNRASFWPRKWNKDWWKPTPKNRLRELAKAGALILAEMERLLRAKSQLRTFPKPTFEQLDARGVMAWDEYAQWPNGAESYRVHIRVRGTSKLVDVVDEGCKISGLSQHSLEDARQKALNYLNEFLEKRDGKGL